MLQQLAPGPGPALLHISQRHHAEGDVAEEHLPGRGQRLLQHLPAHHRTPGLQRAFRRREEDLQHPNTVPVPAAGGERAQESAGQRQEGVRGGSCPRRCSDLRDRPHQRPGQHGGRSRGQCWRRGERRQHHRGSDRPERGVPGHGAAARPV